MAKWLRMLFWLAVLSGAGFAVYTALQRRNEPAAGPQPRFEPVPPTAPIEPEADTAVDTATEAAAGWVTPIDGVAPDGYPIKVNSKSGIYHVPGGRSYDRTAADRCYASAADAQADGYRQAKA